jgi:uncharacterized membrane protein
MDEADDRPRWRLFFPPWLRFLPADLAASVGVTLLTVGAVFLPVVRDTVLRFAFALVFLSFVPGYVLVAALFPGRAPEPGFETERADAKEITGAERVALSVGVSVALVTFTGMSLSFTPWGIRVVPLVVVLSLLVGGLIAVAVRRRRALAPRHRFAVPWRDWLDAVRSELFGRETRIDTALNVVLIVSVLFVAGSVGYAVAVPTQDEKYTEFYLLSEQADGELTAGDYPATFTAGVPRELVVGVENHEYEAVSYTVVIEIQRVQRENGSTRVVEQGRVGQLESRVQHSGTWRQRHTVAPSLTGDRLRLTYLLYRESVPENPTTENAYRDLQLWVNVTETG